MKILIHVCCGPCGTYIIKRLKEQEQLVAALFFNPNIYPLAEYSKRLMVARQFLKEENVPLLEENYDHNEYLNFLKEKKKKPTRCAKCFSLRLAKTAQVASRHGFEAFTTTLLVSPYQDQKCLRKIGKKYAKKYDILFYEEDFVSGYRQSRVMAGQKRMYQQKYCGCEFSLKEKKDGTR